MPQVSHTNIPRDLDETVGTANMVGVLLSTVTYGVHLTLFSYLLRLYFDRELWTRRSRRTSPRPSWKLLAYAVPLFLLATAGLCLQTWLNHRAFIGHRNFPGGPLAYMVSESRNAGSLAVTAVYVVLNWISDGMLLWRFYCFFKHSRLVLIMSSVMIISLIVVGSVFLPSISTLNTNLWTDNSTTPSLVYLALSLSINVILTLVIALRLLWYRRQLHRIVFGGRYTSLYTSIVAMFVESASIYALVALVSIISLAANSPVQVALLPMLGQLQAIPSILITIRIMEFRAIPIDADYSSGMPSTIQFSGRPLSPPDRAITPGPEKNPFGPPPSYPSRCASRSSTIIYEKTSLGGVTVYGGSSHNGYSASILTPPSKPDSCADLEYTRTLTGWSSGSETGKDDDLLERKLFEGTFPEAFGD